MAKVVEVVLKVVDVVLKVALVRSRRGGLRACFRRESIISKNFARLLMPSGSP